ncbi:MAG TPA: hypothetical protein VMQ52_00400 [Candidatus Saccharimonadales bacterium]|jgi:uridine kinase|nr:hypothetical protein [Candidatus Saccharimonadales bacterium]
MFNDLVNEIDQKKPTNGSVVVAISGFGGSGKTTLTKKLVEHYSLIDGQVIHLDNFIIDHAEGDGILGGYDWERFESVLQDVRDGKRLYYQVYDWPNDKLTDWYIDEPLPPIVIVEGIRLLQPNLLPYFDVCVWIDCPIDVSAQRGKKRDSEGKKDPNFDLATHLKKWDDVWIPKDKKYSSEFNPKKLATFIYKDA